MKLLALLASSPVLPLAFGTAACSTPKFVGRPSLTVTPGTSLPPPTTTDVISTARDFVIGPLDELSVEVYGIPDLSRQVQVDASGNVSLPLGGTLRAAGLTPRQLATAYDGSLRGRYVRDPKITVNLTQMNSQRVTVEGSVTKPGLYPVVGNMTLLRAIAQAEGTTEFAVEDRVVIFRTVAGRNMAALYDLRGIRLGMYDDPQIYANDVIQVGDSSARRLFRQVLSASSILTAPLIAVLN